MKKLFQLISFVVVLVAVGSPARAETLVPSPPELSATAYFLVDVNSGAVLAEHNADIPLPPASLTKMMTAYVLATEMEAGRVKPDDMVTVSENAWSQNPIFAGSSLMWIEPGKDVSISDLERGIVISSGNDATVAVAEYLAGSEAVFAEMMNTQAEALGMKDSYFVNSHGLPHPDHVVTARDLATLATAMIKRFPEHYKIYREPEFTYNGIRQYNRNTLMSEDPSVDGLKTGHTQEAGYCLVASAERRGMRLVSVVMGTKSTKARKNETRSLLNYGFRFFETVDLYPAMHELEQPRIWKGQQDYVPVGLMEATVLTLPRGKAKDLETSVELQPQLVAPLAQGDPVGSVTLSIDGEAVFEAPVVALETVEPGGFFARLWDTILMWITSLFATS
ncbi:MAG: D-alanyl-D-alanine carboxypeptidase [Halieaceae bacterium]|nr:D-alanyl-D-alanine carboxypeptidase [Halieaceae bacterium]MCP5205529.1 D-alanyl-D-alanine carboxypeptidase [Pseudomonadales bacterium]